MANYVNMFNSKLLEFFDEMTIYDHVVNFSALKTVTKTIIAVTPDSPQKMFRSSVTDKYGKQIIDRNEAFFLEETYKEADNTLVSSVKSVWKSIDQKNKDIVWDYFNVLVYLDKKCE